MTLVKTVTQVKRLLLKMKMKSTLKIKTTKSLKTRTFMPDSLKICKKWITWMALMIKKCMMETIKETEGEKLRVREEIERHQSRIQKMTKKKKR
mgnify:CR=1 FL=1